MFVKTFFASFFLYVKIRENEIMYTIKTIMCVGKNFTKN